MEIPEDNYYIDRGYKGIARARCRYLNDLRKLIRERGIKNKLKRSGSDSYILESRDRYRGIDLIFEKRDGYWQINKHNRRVIFNNEGVDPAVYLENLLKEMGEGTLEDKELEFRLRYLRDLM